MLIMFQKEMSKSNDAAPANICVAALCCQQQNWFSFQHIHLLLLKVKHFISKIHKLASLEKYFKLVQSSLFWECFPVSTFINLFLVQCFLRTKQNCCLITQKQCVTQLDTSRGPKVLKKAMPQFLKMDRWHGAFHCTYLIYQSDTLYFP